MNWFEKMVYATSNKDPYLNISFLIPYSRPRTKQNKNPVWCYTLVHSHKCSSLTRLGLKTTGVTTTSSSLQRDINMNTVQIHYASIIHNDCMWLREETMSVKTMLENYIHVFNNIVSLCVEWTCFTKYI